MDEALLEELLRNLISLRTLSLEKCPLPPQGMQYLTALQSLNVWRYEVVDPFNDWDEMEWYGLRNLLSLHFYNLPKLVSLSVGLQHLTSLQSLYISDCPELTSMPEWIGGLTSLQTLEIWDCPSLTSLPEWIDGLTSLQTLAIRGCPKLTSLPKWIGGLTSLQTLEIQRCTILSERCKREISEDWPKIAKIPNLKGDLSPPDKKKAALKNRNLIKSFGCCNCSTTVSYCVNRWHKLIIRGQFNLATTGQEVESKYEPMYKVM